MAVRWVTSNLFVTADQDRLVRIVIHEEGCNKQSIKAQNGEYMQERNVLIKRGDGYEFKE